MPLEFFLNATLSILKRQLPSSSTSVSQTPTSIHTKGKYNTSAAAEREQPEQVSDLYHSKPK